MSIDPLLSSGRRAKSQWALVAAAYLQKTEKIFNLCLLFRLILSPSFVLRISYMVAIEFQDRFR